VSARGTERGDVRLAAGDRAGALLAYEERLAIRRKLAAAVIPRDLLRLGLSVANPLPHRTEPPIISVVDLDWLGKGERLVLFLVQQAPNVHIGAVAEQVPELIALDQTFTAKLAEVRSSATPRGLGVGVLLKHVVALRLAEGMVRSGEGELMPRPKRSRMGKSGD
jgi:hypothetical protein